ncbi:uncharacterized protein LOC110109576 [Dendrobium catenatum]|uniref:uncharacterized protein LOC110109576 n=1 Tax=Dendrobium catenatum TaxID=906689 RepID=UPI0010A0A956|nr:uncharacterized protein LOC110109576 [Dendrobium catenatum]
MEIYGRQGFSASQNSISKIWKYSGWSFKESGTASWKILSDGGNSLKQIIRWNVVNGINIDVFNDTWILDKSLNNWPTFVIPHDDSSFLVSNLISNGRWNEDAIGKIKINTDSSEDKRELMHQLCGKSIFGLLLEKSVNYMGCRNYWCWIKKAKLNPRVENVLWRIFSDAIPTKKLLVYKRLLNWILCPRDCFEDEYLNHVTARSKKLKEVFLQIEKWGFHIHVFDSLLEYINWFYNQCSFIVNLYCNVTFFSWKCRNNLIHNGKEDNSMNIGAHAVSYSSTMAQRSINFSGKWGANQPSWLSNIHWHPPPPNWLKFNVDASLLPSFKA